MESETSFDALKRRTTEMLETVQKSVPERPSISMLSLPAMPNMPSLPTMPAMPSMPAIPAMPAMTSLPTMAFLSHNAHYKATWEPILDVRLPLASHSCSVVAGTAYIFGGETAPGKLADNAVHAVTLPMNFAQADYLKIPAKSDSDTASTTGTAYYGDNSSRDLSDVPLEGASSGQEAAGSSAKGKGKAPSGDDVPAARMGHASAAIGARVFVFGGHAGNEDAPLNESGRVWVFDTRSHVWTYLDPASPAPGVAEPVFPAPRSSLCMATTDAPRDSHTPSDAVARHGPHGPHANTHQTWKQWAQGDSATMGTPQAPIVGNLAAAATDEESDGYGTLFIHGGRFADGSLTSDVWAFDIRSRVWSELPSAPGPARSGAAICVSRTQSRLFRFGGFSGTDEIGGQLDYLPLSVETVHDDGGGNGGDLVLATRSAWQTIVPAGSSSVSHNNSSTTTTPSEDEPLASVASEWPAPRSVAGLECITVGGGRELLVLVMGKRSGPGSAPSAGGSGHRRAGTFWDDVWVFRPPPPTRGLSVASVTHSLRGLWSRRKSSSTRTNTSTSTKARARASASEEDDTDESRRSRTHVGQGSWHRVDTRPFDDEYEGDDEYDGDMQPRARGWFATSSLGDVEGGGLVLWGGVRQDGKRLADGWILRLD